jgi:hypothetical protein
MERFLDSLAFRLDYCALVSNQSYLIQQLDSSSIGQWNSVVCDLQDSIGFH